MWKTSLIRQPILAMAASLVFSSLSVVAQEPEFVDHLFPPELIVRNRDEIDLSDEQLKKIGEITSEFGTQVDGFRNDIDDNNRKLIMLLQATPIDETAALKQLESFLLAEQKLKQLHFTAMIRVRNVLTATQQAVLATKLKAMSHRKQDRTAAVGMTNETEMRLRNKVERIRREVESRVANGLPPMEAGKLMEEFSQTINRGDVEAAEVILDRVLKLLGIESESSASETSGKQSRSTKPRPSAVGRLKSQPTVSYTALKQSVENLRVEDVEWRKIEWEICLLDGLRRSRAENKPLVLWVFIDRPIDDERC